VPSVIRYVRDELVYIISGESRFQVLEHPP
jgi:hypothetical protein